MISQVFENFHKFFSYFCLCEFQKKCSNESKKSQQEQNMFHWEQKNISTRTEKKFNIKKNCDDPFKSLQWKSVEFFQ